MGVSGTQLSNPRVISNRVMSSTYGQTAKNDRWRPMLVMSFGQLVDHDLALTPTMTGAVRHCIFECILLDQK